METTTQQLLCKNVKALPPSFIKGMLKATQDPEIISFSGGLRPKRGLLPVAGLGLLFPGVNGLGGNGFGAAIIVKY